MGATLNTIAGSFPAPPFNVLIGTQSRAVLWDREHIHNLGTLGGTDFFVTFINDRDEIAGVSFTSTIVPTRSYSGCTESLPPSSRSNDAQWFID